LKKEEGGMTSKTQNKAGAKYIVGMAVAAIGAIAFLALILWIFTTRIA